MRQTIRQSAVERVIFLMRRLVGRSVDLEMRIASRNRDSLG